MEAIKDTLKNLIERLEDKRKGPAGEDPQAWLKKVLTKNELRHIKFHYFRKGILGVSVDSSAQLYSLTLQKEGLLVKLNRQSSAVKDIRFRIGEIK